MPQRERHLWMAPLSITYEKQATAKDARGRGPLSHMSETNIFWLLRDGQLYNDLHHIESQPSVTSSFPPILPSLLLASVSKDSQTTIQVNSFPIDQEARGHHGY